MDLIVGSMHGDRQEPNATSPGGHFRSSSNALPVVVPRVLHPKRADRHNEHPKSGLKHRLSLQ